MRFSVRKEKEVLEVYVDALEIETKVIARLLLEQAQVVYIVSQTLFNMIELPLLFITTMKLYTNLFLWLFIILFRRGHKSNQIFNAQEKKIFRSNCVSLPTGVAHI